MEHIDFTIILFLGSVVAGLIGALSGLGGGLVIVPILVLALGIATHYAIGASLVAVIATSLGASVPFIQKGFVNIRAAMFFQTATAIGAIIGAFLTNFFSDSTLQIIFGVVLLITVASKYIVHRQIPEKELITNPISRFLKLNSTYPTRQSHEDYKVQRPLIGWFILLISGGFSGMLGIGSGSVNVIALEKVMRFPFKVSTSTSNYMIGVTAAASAGAFLHMGYISPPIVMPMIPGVLLGAYLGALLLLKTNVNKLKHLFTVLVIVIAMQMIAEGLGHKA